MGRLFGTGSSETDGGLERSEVLDNSDVGLTTVFDWSRVRRPYAVLSGFLAFSLIIHGFGFYLFRVAYPPPERVEPDIDAISVLDSSNSSVRHLLQLASDRSIYLFPPSRASETRLRIEDDDVRFAPSLSAESPALFEKEYSWSPPPKTVFTSQDSFPDGPGKNVTVALYGGLTDLAIAPWSILRDSLDRIGEIPRLRVNLAVEVDGGVTVDSIEGLPEGASQRELAEVVESTLRFLPINSRSTGWIEISKIGNTVTNP